MFVLCLGFFPDVYTIPCDHAGGTFWYHPHHHGSTSLQMGGGAMGALIIKDRVEVHGIPDQIANMPELVLTIQEMDPELSTFDRDATGDELFATTAVQRYRQCSTERDGKMIVTTCAWSTHHATRACCLIHASHIPLVQASALGITIST